MPSRLFLRGGSPKQFRCNSPRMELTQPLLLLHDSSAVNRPVAPPKDSHATATMRANPGRDTKPELRIRSLLHRAGVRFRKDVRLDLPAGRVRPDVVFRQKQVAVFVDGC